MAITQQDIEVVRQLLNVYETMAVRHGMDETEFIAFKLGGISTPRAQRLIIATRQNVTTKTLQTRQRR